MMENEQSTKDEKQLMIDACRDLYIANGGRRHREIERQMRQIGWPRFSVRRLYCRGGKPGWIRLFDWERLVAGPAPAAGALTQLSFGDWLKTLPGGLRWDWKYQQYLLEKLQRVSDGHCKRLMIFMPPRHGKSEMVTVRYAAWNLLRNPSLNVIIGSYNQGLANRFSRKIRRVLCDGFENARQGSGGPEPRGGTGREPRGDAAGSRPPARPDRSGDTSERAADGPIFPFIRSRPANTVAEWETSMGGGLRAVGVGAGITGYGAGLVIVDDPVKSRAEAESETYRRRVFDWFNDDLYTRLEPDGVLVLIMTRWHEDDLAGRLLREMAEEGGEQWEVVNLPAIAEGEESENVKEWNSENEQACRNAGTPACNGGDSSHRHVGTSKTSTDVKPNTPSAAPGGIAGKGARGPTDDAPGGIAGKGARGPGSDILSAIDRIDAQIAKLSEPRNYPYIIEKGKKVTLYPAGALRPEFIPEELFRLENEKAEMERQLSIQNPRSQIPNPQDPLGRLPGQPLCPERFDLDTLRRIKNRLGTYSFNALYQQDPMPPDGATFKLAWFRNIIDVAPPGLRWCRGYDLAVSTKTSADYTASFRCAADKMGNIYIADGFRARIEFPEQRRYVVDRIRNEWDTAHGIEASLHGKALVQDLRREPSLRGRAFRAVEVDGDKLTRALAWANTAEEGKIILVRGAWIADFLDEVMRFPNGRHDDQIDAVSIAIRMLAGRGKRAWSF